MDISDTDHVLLFDVLDADGSGNLSVSEIVQGLVQVQAPARALDIVRLGGADDGQLGDCLMIVMFCKHFQNRIG